MFNSPSLFFWSRKTFKYPNFGDHLGLVISQMICGRCLAWSNDEMSPAPRLLAVGSILHFAKTGDIVWGSGVNGKHLQREKYRFSQLDVRLVRGPLTRNFLSSLGIECPAVFGDPAFLLPIFYRPSRIGKRREVFITHYSEKHLYSNLENSYSTDEHCWSAIVDAICSANLVVSSSLHGIIVAEAFGIPARLLRVTKNEPIFKYRDYYEGTGRPNFQVAQSLEEARLMGGEHPPIVNLHAIYETFPFDRFSIARPFAKPIIESGGDYASDARSCSQ